MCYTAGRLVLTSVYTARRRCTGTARACTRGVPGHVLGVYPGMYILASGLLGPRLASGLLGPRLASGLTSSILASGLTSSILASGLIKSKIGLRPH